MSIVGRATGVTAVVFSYDWTVNGGTAFPSVTITLSTTATTPAGRIAFTVRAADGVRYQRQDGTLTNWP